MTNFTFLKKYVRMNSFHVGEIELWHRRWHRTTIEQIFAIYVFLDFPTETGLFFSLVSVCFYYYCIKNCNSVYRPKRCRCLLVIKNWHRHENLNKQQKQNQYLKIGMQDNRLKVFHPFGVFSSGKQEIKNIWLRSDTSPRGGGSIRTNSP